MSPRDEFPMSRIDSSGRSAPTSDEAVEERRRLDEQERREQPWSWLGERRRVKTPEPWEVEQ